MHNINMSGLSCSSAPESNECSVSAINKCQTNKVSKLCILDLNEKLKNGSDYDIGGSYSGHDPELWFYFTTSVCPGPNYLLNLFVCNRRVLNFKVTISKSSEFTNKQKDADMIDIVYLSEDKESFSFRAAKPNESFYIKTFCFSKAQVKALENILVYIPIKIELDVSHLLDENIIRKIKLNHQLGEHLSKQEKTDFILESTSGKKYNVHKIFLAAFIPQLRETIKNNTSSKALLDINDDEMAILLQFLYTGFIEEIWKQDCVLIMKLATKFELKNLFYMLQLVIQDQIKVNNAVEIALLAEQHQLEELQKKVFAFIKKNPAVFQSEGWKTLDNVEVAKKLSQFTNVV